MATLEKAVAMLNGNAPRGTSILITFDDGYLDNYTLAFPILRKHGVQGVFFLPTAFIGAGKVPWWDAIAYMIKKCRKKSIHLEYPEPGTFDLENNGAAQVSMQILHVFIQPAVEDSERFITELEEACETLRPETSSERLFLNWEEAREMQGHGMAFGSHTHAHDILSKLSRERQRDELVRRGRFSKMNSGTDRYAGISGRSTVLLFCRHRRRFKRNGLPGGIFVLRRAESPGRDASF